MEGRSFYASCLDTSRAAGEGASPVRAELARIDSITSLGTLRDEVARLNRAGIGVLFTFAAVPDPTRSTQVIGDLSAGGLGLPDAQYYSREDETTQRTRNAYRRAVERLFELAGAGPDSARTAAERAMAVETRLAQAPMRIANGDDPPGTGHVLAAPDLATLTPHWSWPEYFETLGVPRAAPVAINVQQPAYFEALDRMLTDMPLAAWKSYLRAQYLETAAPALSDPFVQAIAPVGAAIGASPPAERWRYCVGETDRNLRNALGEEYVRRAFTPAAKVRVLAMVRTIESVLREDLDTLSWMSAATRREVVAIPCLGDHEPGNVTRTHAAAGAGTERRGGRIVRRRGEIHGRDPSLKSHAMPRSSSWDTSTRPIVCSFLTRQEREVNLRIEYTGQDAIDQLRPLWLYLHHHHQAIAPQLGPYVDDDTSWSMRRRFYAECLSYTDSFVLAAYAGQDLVGYALVRIEATSTMWSDTWVTGSRTAELETLVVAPDQRGQGVGATLLDRVDAELRRLGIDDMIIGAVPDNTDVLDMYRRRGFEPTWLVMTRFAARGSPPA